MDYRVLKTGRGGVGGEKYKKIQITNLSTHSVIETLFCIAEKGRFHPLDTPISQSVSQSTNQPTNQSINQSINQPIVHQPAYHFPIGEHHINSHELHKGGEAFIQPEVIPPGWCHEVSKPLWRERAVVRAKIL